MIHSIHQVSFEDNFNRESVKEWGDFTTDQNSAALLEGWHTPGSRDIFNALFGAAIAEGRENITAAINKFHVTLMKNKIDLNAVHQTLQFTFLDAALFLPIFKNDNKEIALRISEELYKFLLEQMQKHLSMHNFNKILANSTDSNFKLLQRSITSHSFINVQKTIAVLSEPGREKLLHENLINLTRHQYSSIQLSLLSGNRQITKLVFDVLTKKSNRSALKSNLQSCTTTGFMALLTAIKSGTEEDVDNVVALLETLDTNTSLIQNLDNRNVHGFMILQAAIRSNSIAKLTKVNQLLMRKENRNSLLKNLKNRTQDGYMAITCAVGTGSATILRMVIDLFMDSANEELLKENLNNLNQDGVSVLQTAVASKSKQILEIMLALLSKNGYERELEKNIIARCANGFMILQESLKTGESDLVRMIVAMLVKNDIALIFNLCNINAANYTCLMDAVKSGSMEDVELIITLSENHLAHDMWKKLLVVETQSCNAASTALHLAIESGHGPKVKAVLNTMKRAFGEKSADILRNMVKEEHKFYLNTRTRETLPLIAEYLPRSLQQILPSLPTREGKEGVVFRLLNQTSQVPSESEFNHLFRVLQKVVDRHPEQLTDISDNGWSHLSKLLLSHGKRDTNKLLSSKKLNILFSYIFKRMQKLPLNEFKRILSAKTTLNVPLLHHAMYYAHDGEVIDILIDQFCAPGFEDLLAEQLFTCQETGRMLMMAALSSQCPANIDKAYSLLSKPKYHDALRQNLKNNTEEGYRVLHDAIRQGSVEIVNKIAGYLGFLDEKEIWALNLANHTKIGYSILHDALISGVDDNSITIINLSEQYLDLATWKNILKEKSIRGYYSLQIAANKGSETTVKLLIEAIIRAFGQEAELIIENMLQEEGKYHSKKLNHTEVVKIVASYFATRSSVVEQAAMQILDVEEGEIIVPPTTKKRRISGHVTRAAMSELSEVDSQSSAPFFAPCGGISDKYLSLEGPLPKLPEPQSQGNENGPTQFLHTHTLAFLHTLSSSAIRAQRKVIRIQSAAFEADYHTHRSHPRGKMLTFVVAGRKMQALIPQPTVGRSVLVLTQNEYDEISSNLPARIDVLVVKKLKSPTHGNYQQKLALPTCRRLAIFLFAEVLKLSSFMMIDDNIAKVSFNARSESWDGLYQLLRNQLGNLYCVSVRTDSYKTSRQAELGSKLFMINLQEIRAKMGGFINFFALFPQASEAHKCLEDYYLQVMFYAMCKASSQGYQILDEDLVSLTRSKKHTHAFIRRGGGLAQLFEGLGEIDLSRLTENVRRYVTETRTILNNIIEENIQKYQDRKRYIENADLQLKHARANKIAYLRPSVLPLHLTGSFMTRFQTLANQIQFLPNTMRDYQKAAIDSFAATGRQNGNIILPTSAGKTILQCQIVLMARACLNRGQHIFIVTPHISLVKQFYLDFIEFNKTNKTDGLDLRVPAEAIITVSSNKQSCHIKTLLMNKRMRNQNCIFIFCAQSLASFLNESHYQLPQVPLLFADEYHYYPSILRRCVDKISTPKPRIIGCTATPFLHEPLPTLYQYSRAEGVQKGYIASVIADSLGVEYSKRNVWDLIHCFPTMIDQYHPGNGSKITLREGQGIFFLPSIAHCEMAYKILVDNGITCHRIHSKNKHQRKELEQFIKNEEPGVLLAVKLCLIGLNIKKLAYVVIGQNASPDNHAQVSKVEQMIGRVMRVQGDKIGYILCFKNVLENIIKPSIGNQVITQRINPDYLQQENVYYTRNGKSWKVCDNYSKTFIKKVFLQSSRYKAKFKIIPQPVNNFSLNFSQRERMLGSDAPEMHQHVISLSELEDFTIPAFSSALRADHNDSDLLNLTLWGESGGQFLTGLYSEADKKKYRRVALKEVSSLIVEDPIFIQQPTRPKSHGSL